MKYEKLSKHQAILKAKTLAGYIPEHKPLKQEAESLPQIAVLTKYYQSALFSIGKSKQSQQYAESRNLNPARLGIGYSGADIGKTWNGNLQKAGLEAGVLKVNKKGVYLPKISYCLLFAMKNRAGQVVYVYGRSILDKADARHFYRSGRQQGLYTGYPAAESKKLILTESIIDAATLIEQPEISGILFFQLKRKSNYLGKWDA